MKEVLEPITFVLAYPFVSICIAEVMSDRFISPCDRIQIQNGPQ